MVERYRQRSDLAKTDIRFVLSAGDECLLKQRAPGKLSAHALGPFRFESYLGRRRLQAEIVDPRTGKKFTVASAHLVPVRSSLLAARLAQLTERVEPADTVPADSAAPPPKPPGYCSFSSESSDVSSSLLGLCFRGRGVLDDVGGVSLKIVREEVEEHIKFLSHRSYSLSHSAHAALRVLSEGNYLRAVTGPWCATDHVENG